MQLRNVIKNFCVLAILFASVGIVTACNENQFIPNVDVNYSESHFSDQWNTSSEIADNYNYYDVLVISDSANFEMANQAVLVHFLEHGSLEILDTETMAVSYTNITYLTDLYENHVFITNPDEKIFMPLEFNTSGVYGSNLESTYEDLKSELFTQSSVNDFKQQQERVEAAERN